MQGLKINPVETVAGGFDFGCDFFATRDVVVRDDSKL
jgi:hypothetical protein